MNILPNFLKTFKENLRDWKILLLVLLFAPIFVFIMYFYFGDSDADSYDIAVINRDAKGAFSRELIDALEAAVSEDEDVIFTLHPVPDFETAERMIREQEADLAVIIPEDFSDSFQGYLETKSGLVSPITNYGDPGNMNFLAAASFLDYTVFTYGGLKAGIDVPVQIEYEYTGEKSELREFDLYVPALLVLSIIMMLFSSGASIVREVEKETIVRLSLSRLSSFDFITALSMNQVLIGVSCFVLTLLSAFITGYRTAGSYGLMLIVGMLTCFSVISIGIITACFLKNMFGLLTVGCFPFFILMFFSDCFMPLPKIDLLKIAGHQVYLNDILPTATATRALNKVMNYSSNFSEIGFELAWILGLSLVYFLAAMIVFRKRFIKNTILKGGGENAFHV
ncbi:MAG: ABC transporter permease [Spirochaetales bacterium]|nr:ABC transporter permease [Spirochaetales bacterium]